MADPLRLEQLLYSWSASNLFGRRGFGVTAASAGWLPRLQGGDDILGPVVSYPEPGRGGSQPPAHGGFAVLRGTPVLFRRVSKGTDALDRPGNYTVHVLLGADTPIDADTAAGLLAGDWLTSPLPTGGPTLPVAVLPRPGARRGSAQADPVVCGALLQGLRDERRVVLAVPSEVQGRLALCDAVRRLPPGLRSLTFSTLESEPDRAAFDVAVAVAGWETPSRGSTALRVGGDADGIDPRCARWGRELAASTAAALRGLPEPVTVAALGTRLDGLATLRTDPRALTPQQLLSVLTSPEGQAWAAEPGAVAVAKAVVSGMDPALGPQFAKAAARRPAVSSLLSSVGWEVVSSRSGVTSRRAAETLLLGLGEEQAEIDLAVLSAADGALSAEESGRYLRLTAAKGRGIDPAVAGKLTWDNGLAAAHPAAWFEAVVLGKAYQGPRAGSTVLARLSPAAVAAVLQRAHQRDPGEQTTARRLWAVLPETRRERTAFLRLLAASGTEGLSVVFEQLLARPSIGPGVRESLLQEFWPILVRELQLPPYLGEAMAPSGSSGAPRWAVPVLALITVIAVAAVVFLLLR